MRGAAETCSGVSSCKGPFCRSKCQGKLKMLLRGSRTHLAPHQVSLKAGVMADGRAPHQLRLSDIQFRPKRGGLRLVAIYCFIVKVSTISWPQTLCLKTTSEPLQIPQDRQKRGAEVDRKGGGLPGTADNVVRVGLRLGLMNLVRPSLPDSSWALRTQPVP